MPTTAASASVVPVVAPLSPVAPVALVTGATAGLGAVFARELARWGHDLVLVARDAERLRAQGAALERDFGIAVETLPADLATDEGAQGVAARLGGERPVDVLVNNAGFGSKGALATADPAGQDRMLRLHVLAVNTLTRAALPGMVERRRGVVITVSSVASYLTSAGNVNYCATKGYQRMAMEALARELEGSGVYVQALCPGFTRTEFHQRAALSMGHVPAALWLTADRVVAESLAAMRRGSPTVVVPDWKYRAIVALLRHAPASLLRRAQRMHRRDERIGEG